MERMTIVNQSAMPLRRSSVVGARSFTYTTEHAWLRGECWIPVPLRPPIHRPITDKFSARLCLDAVETCQGVIFDKLTDAKSPYPAKTGSTMSRSARA